MHTHVHDLKQEEGEEKEGPQHVNSCLFVKVQLLLELRKLPSAETQITIMCDSDNVHMS